MSDPHTLSMIGPDGSPFPVHHMAKCDSEDCRGCYPHARSHQGIAILAKRRAGLMNAARVRAIIEVS